MRTIAAEIREDASIDTEELGAELPDIPDLLVGEKSGQGLPYLCDTEEGFLTTTKKLIARKAYR